MATQTTESLTFQYNVSDVPATVDAAFKAALDTLLAIGIPIGFLQERIGSKMQVTVIYRKSVG